MLEVARDAIPDAVGTQTRQGTKVCPGVGVRQCWSMIGRHPVTPAKVAGTGMAGKSGMLDLKDVYYFVQVVDRGGFTAAGEALRLPKSTLSHRVKELEASLGVRLISRTSRQFAMTEVGQEFYQ